MSQSATLYRVSHDTFEQLEKSAHEKRFNISSAKNYTTFQGSFMGLEFILSKGQDASATDLIKEIFNPKQSIGGQDFASLTPEEQFEYYENGMPISYLDTTIISKLSDLLDKISEQEIHLKYNANELNDNGIYPGIWHDDNSHDRAYNERQILEDYKELKNIIKQAAGENDYILVFVG
jgi:hypothetical protein